MQQDEKKTIKVDVSVKASVEVVWKKWTSPEDIMKWNNASPDWYTPKAENQLSVGGKFLYRMEAKDGSFGFDFTGRYDQVTVNRNIAYTIADGRSVNIDFDTDGEVTMISETFEAESLHSIEMQRAGWQSILDNFKKYVELQNH
ncbi:MAG: SRPBCC domain-containing protein [Ignavibacteriales bacterium]|nr:SRPBCC domain-containing protein [Ignavibacteriales bacterium]